MVWGWVGAGFEFLYFSRLVFFGSRLYLYQLPTSPLTFSLSLIPISPFHFFGGGGGRKNELLSKDSPPAHFSIVLVAGNEHVRVS